MAKYIGFTFNHSLVIYALLASPLVVLTVVVAVILFRRQDARFRLGPPIVVLGGSVLLCLALIALDPARFISWFVD
jgi:predicted Co/Zn/Cd cation transporter (cation efflux family)